MVNTWNCLQFHISSFYFKARVKSSSNSDSASLITCISNPESMFFDGLAAWFSSSVSQEKRNLWRKMLDKSNLDNQNSFHNKLNFISCISFFFSKGKYGGEMVKDIEDAQFIFSQDPGATDTKA